MLTDQRVLFPEWYLKQLTDYILNMPQQTVSNVCVNLNDENDSSQKFVLRDSNPPETFSKCRVQKISKIQE